MQMKWTESVLLNRASRCRAAVARTPAFQFRGRNEDVRNIGKQLAVGAVIEGGLSRSENKLHITAQLVSTQDGYHFWSGTFDSEPNEIYSVEEQIVYPDITRVRYHARGREPDLGQPAHRKPRSTRSLPGGAVLLVSANPAGHETEH